MVNGSEHVNGRKLKYEDDDAVKVKLNKQCFINRVDGFDRYVKLFLDGKWYSRNVMSSFRILITSKIK